MQASESGGSMAWFNTNLKSRHALRGRRGRHVVAPGGNRAGVVEQLLHQQRHEQFPVEPRLGAVVVVLRQVPQLGQRLEAP